MNTPAPSPLGLRKSFGFGDRLGLATPGHLAAVQGTGFAPVFAQQSIREMTRTRREPAEIVAAAWGALESANYVDPWGADADHLKTAEDAERTAKAGFTMFTIDPSAHVNNAADAMGEAELRDTIRVLAEEGTLEPGWEKSFLNATFDIPGAGPLSFTQETLWRAAVKYGRAIAYSAGLTQTIQRLRPGADVEVSVDETDTPTRPEEHLFFALDLRHRGVTGVTSLAPRFVGDFEKGVDYRGDLAALEDHVRWHAAIAKYCGPYKLSIHSGSDKFSAYPVIGRICGDLLHVKTAGTNYLEALRAVLRANPALFDEIAVYTFDRFAEDRASYHISTTDAEVAVLRDLKPSDNEALWLDERPGRQLLHVTFGSVLSAGKCANGRTFRDAIVETLTEHADLHHELVASHLGKHLSLLNAG